MPRLESGTGLRRLGCLLGLFGLLGAAGPARAQGWMISLLDGDAVVVDGVQRLAARAGQRLAAGAIVETTSTTVVLRLEASEQTTFDLGADTRAMITPGGFGPRSEQPPQLYLLQGWVKATARGTGMAPGIVTPALELLPFKGSFVLQAKQREQSVFVETGRADLIERRTGGTTVSLGAGEFYGALGAARGSVSPRPAPAWVNSVPRAFRDPLPLRAAALRERRVDLQVLPGPTYTQLADWLGAEAPLRGALPERFASLAQEREFRAAVLSNVNAHPEWAAVLCRTGIRSRRLCREEPK